MTTPTQYVRLKQLIELLGERGFSAWDCRKLIDDGVLVPRKFHSHGRKKFVWAEVQEALQLNHTNNVKS